MTQTIQGCRSTKPNPCNNEALPDSTSQFPAVKSRKLYVVIKPIRKLYTDVMGCFPVRSRRRNHYIMLDYHVDTIVILVHAFHSRHYSHRHAVYNHIMSCLKSGSNAVDLQVLENEDSKAYIVSIEDKWTCNFQLVPLNFHQRNVAKRAIHTFKAHFLEILSGISDSFPNFLRDQLLPQTELTIDLLR